MQTVVLDPKAKVISYWAVYVRISQDQEKKREGVKRQTDISLDRARQAGATHVDVYEDNDCSASKYAKKPRKDYALLVETIEAGIKTYAGIAVWMEDRPNRILLNVAMFVKVCTDAGVTRFIGQMGELDLSNPMHCAMLYQRAIMSEMEIEFMRARALALQESWVQAGRWRSGGYRAFGEIGEGKHRTTKKQADAERLLIQQAAQRLLSGGTLWGIVREWNANDITTPTGKPWRNIVLRRLLISSRMIGARERDGQLFFGEWEPILERHVWEEVRRILKDPARYHQKGVPVYLLTGLLYCAICGNRLRGESKARAQGRRVTYYRCQQTETSNCNKVHCMAAPLEELIVSVLFEAIESPTFYELGTPDNNPAQELYEERVRLQGLLERLEDKFARELISEATYKRQRRDLLADIERINNRIAQTDAERVKLHMPRNVREVWPDFGIDRQRAILGAVIEKIVVSPQPIGRIDPDALDVVWTA